MQFVLIGVVVLGLLSQFMGGVKEAEEILVQADKRYNEGNYEKAIPRYLKVIKRNPESTNVMICALFNLGYSYSNLEKYDLALRCFKRIAREYPDEPEGKESAYYVANFYFLREEYDEALKIYEEFLKVTKQTDYIIDVNMQMSNCYFMKKNYRKGYELLRDVETKYKEGKIVSRECDYIRFCSYIMLSEEKRKTMKIFRQEKQVELTKNDLEAIEIIEGRLKEVRKASKKKKLTKEQIEKQQKEQEAIMAKQRVMSQERKRIEDMYKQSMDYYKNVKWLKSYELLTKLKTERPEYERADELIKKIKQEAIDISKGKFKNKQELYYSKAYLSFIAGNIKEANDYWKKLLEIDPLNQEISEFINKDKTK